MPRPRFNHLPAERRRQLLEAAATEFAARGYEGASLNRLIERAGISKGAFYYYFDGKADLFATVTETAWEALLPERALELDELDAGAFWQRLREAFLETADNARRHPWLPGIAKLLYHPPAAAGLDEVVSGQFARAWRWLGALLARGQELGTIRKDLPEGLLRALVAGTVEACDRWLVEHWDELPEAETDALLTTIFDLLRRLVEPPAAKREGR